MEKFNQSGQIVPIRGRAKPKRAVNRFDQRAYIIRHTSHEGHTIIIIVHGVRSNACTIKYMIYTINTRVYWYSVYYNTSFIGPAFRQRI